MIHESLKGRSIPNKTQEQEQAWPTRTPRDPKPREKNPSFFPIARAGEDQQGFKGGKEIKDSRRSQELVVMGVRRYCSFASHGFLLLLLLFLFLFLDASMAATTPSSPPLDKSQIAIMMNLSSMVNPMGPSLTTKWNTSDSNPCLWRGITCSVRDFNSFSVVTEINLSGYDISNSSIFASICALGTLEVLDLSRNPFNNLSDRSFFASSCSINKRLRSLNLSSSHLVSSLGNLPGFPRLEVLDLSFNSFSGNLSAGLSSFPKLRSLNLSSNKFEGDVPTSMVFSLEELVLSGNQFSGGIPIGLFACENLTMLDLSQNNLTGVVPGEFRKLPKLQTLLLSGNNLRGPIPGTLSMVTTLSRFAANQNNFTGSIPSGITKHVRMLDLSYNNISGEIPPDFFFGSSLETVDLSINMLEGPIPGKFSPSLYRLRLGGNFIDGSIPESIGDAMNLSYLELDENMLTGVIPSQLGACKKLALLNLASNRLEGPVPREISNLKNLEVLKLQMNNLNGSIPITISDFGNLAILNLSQNAFIGEIPAGLFQLTKLSNIDLQGNKISGTIPKLISSLQYLIELNLGNNNLTGGIPTMPNSLKTALNLSNNHLTGSIPSAIGTLSDLEILDLSLNDLSGQIPTSLSNLQSLTQLVLSYNHLSGSVPTFRQHVLVNITGNPDLTNGTGNSNNTPTSGKRKTHNVVIIFIAVAVALVGLCLLAAIVMVSLSKRIYRVEDEGPLAEGGVVQIINGHLITMNSVHTSAIDFVKAMEAVSSHNIFLKTRFCTYYKAVMPNGSTYSVKKLDWSDKIFQIGSQEKFGHELEVLGKLSNSNVMVPLAYMLTEDSAYLLYEHLYKGTVFDFLHGGRSDVLDWPTRYSIALGVAQGLTFLHGRTQPVLLLDLSTRTIHLKSMNEPQIGDIELYKIIDPSKSSGSLSTIAGTVGYIPPEYAYTMRLTIAGNVYSFGVILLELLTGKPSVNDGIELAKWALSLSATVDQRGQILDTRASGTSAVVHGQMMSVLNIALACVAFSPEARPKMRSVLRMLFNAK